MPRPPDCGAPPPDPNDPQFLAATQWLIGGKADVDELIEAQLKYAQDRLAEGVSDVAPQLLVKVRMQPAEPSELIVYALIVPFSTDEDKDPVLRKLGRDLYRQEKIPVAACLLAEAWRSIRPKAARHVEPRHDPARKEVLTVIAISNGIFAADGGHRRYACVPLRRDPIGDPAGRMVQDGAIEHAATGDGETQVLDSRLLRRFYQGFFECAQAKGWRV